MHNPEFVFENATHQFLWDVETQTDLFISAKQPDVVIVIKKRRTCRKVNFAMPVDHRVKAKENEKKDKNLDLARKLKSHGT